MTGALLERGLDTSSGLGFVRERLALLNNAPLRKSGYAGVPISRYGVPGGRNGVGKHDDPVEPATPDIAWDIRREGRSWSGDEAMARFGFTPEKFEMWEGKLFLSDTERITLLALLLENVGADRAVELGNPDVWREAIRNLS